MWEYAVRVIHNMCFTMNAHAQPVIYKDTNSPSVNLSVSSISTLATSEHTDQVEIPTSVAHRQGQRKSLSTSETLGTFCDYLLSFDSELDLDLLSSSVNVSSPKNRVRTTSSSERPLEVPMATIDDNNQLQGATTVSRHEGPSESATQYTPHHQSPQNPIIPYLESMPSVIQRTEVTTFEQSSTPGTQLESSAVLISEHDLPHELHIA
ncbi:hypothetical protein BYT27DRAFT_6395537 [Phlegmacium glaucopus]|nr:hypothetical protein BYT27DRAFT_6395537 [Phlegmacium glaucopus]